MASVGGKMDEKLIAAIKEMAAGKEEGFNKVYSATYNHVYFRAKEHMKDEEDALDLVQIVFVEAFKNIGSLENPEALYGWLDAITYRQGMKLFRKKKDVLLTEEGEVVFETLESEDIDTMPELSNDQKETSKIISEIIDELPEAQKVALIAFYFDNFSVSQIAEMEECSENTIKSRLNYARKYIKTRVEEREKKEGYRLHSLTLPILLWAFRSMAEDTVMSLEKAQAVYKSSCSSLGLKATTLVAVGGQSAAASVGASASTVAVNTAVATGAKIGTAKALIIAVSIAVGAGAIGGGIYMATGNRQEILSDKASENEVSENITSIVDVSESFEEPITEAEVAEEVLAEEEQETEEKVVYDVTALAEQYSALAYLSEGGVYIVDVDSDGIPELFVLEGTCNADYHYAIYKYSEVGAQLFADTGVDHMMRLFVVNDAESIAWSGMQMGAEFVYKTNLSTGESEKIFEYNYGADEDMVSQFNPDESMTEVYPIFDLSAEGIEDVLTVIGD